MNVLVNALPGVRDVRAPVTAGYLWLLAAWLALDPDLNAEPNDGLGHALHSLGDEIGVVGIGVAVSVAAYLIGVVSQEMSVRVLGRVVGRWLDEEKQALRNRIRELFDGAVPAVKAAGLTPEDESERVAKIGERRKVASRDVIEELELPATLLVGSHEVLFAEVDRLHAEGDFRIAIVPPLVALTIVTAVASDSLAWLVALAPTAVIAWQGTRRRRQSERLIAQAIRSGRVDSPALQKHTEWVADLLAGDGGGEPREA